MFSGLVESITRVLQIEEEQGGGIRLDLARPPTFDDISVGDSIAVNGCCLTIIEFSEGSMSFQAGQETLSKTNLGRLTAGTQVNCERALALCARVGGHLVTGHVDGIATVGSRKDQADWSDMSFEAAPSLLRQMVNKGCITVDGVSLTIVNVTDRAFSVALIPHTLDQTTLGERAPGDAVNLETDLLAKYVQRQLESQS